MQRSELVDGRTRGVVAILAALLVSMLFVAVEPAAADHYTNTTELSGSTNTAAAAAWSKAAFTGTTTEVLLGRDDVFADSLASGAMQGSRPLLLTNSQTLSPDANAELNRLRPSVVNILGGPSAVSTAVENDLKSKGYTVRRFSGPTRLETAIDIARRNLPAATSAILAAAFSPDPADQTRAFADSIAAGGWAADRAFPVLLTENSRLSTVTKNYLRGSVIRTVFVVGGSSAVNDTVITELQQIGMTVRRISGPTRFDTAVRIAQERGAADASKVTEVILTEGQASDAWAAGFAAAAYSASKDAPIVLSNGGTLPAPTATWLSPTAKAAGTKLVCAPRVDAAACDAASEAMGHTAITGSLPRLLAVAAGATAGGVRDVRFTFTEPVSAQVSADKFKLYTYDNTPIVATSAARDTARQDVVVAKFPQSSFAEATVAAVAFDAVRGIASNVQNMEGSSTLQTVTPAVGRTRGPDLVSISGFNIPLGTGSNTWDVDFTFDQAVTACGANGGYKLVTTDKVSGTGIHTLSTSGGDATPQGTTTCRARFSSIPSGYNFDLHVARGFVVAATVSSGAVKNPPTAVDVGDSIAPDLTSVERVSGSTTQVAFNFDRAIDSAVNINQAAAKFKVFDSKANVFTGSSAAPDAGQGANITRVIVTFPSGALRNVLIGGSVDEQAVKGAAVVDTDPTKSNPGYTNGPDEEAFSSVDTSLPRLVSITRTTAGSGAAASVTLRFTYSGTVDRGPAGFFVYSEDGERLALTSCSVNATAGGDDIDCTANSGSAAEYNAARVAKFAGAAYDAVRPAGQAGETADRSRPLPEHGGTIG